MAMLSKRESCIEIAHFDRIYVRLNTLKYVCTNDGYTLSLKIN